MIPKEVGIEYSLWQIKGQVWNLELFKVNAPGVILFELVPVTLECPKLQMLLLTEQYKEFVTRLAWSVKVIKGDTNCRNAIADPAEWENLTEMATSGPHQVMTSHGTGEISYFLSWTNEPCIQINFYRAFHSEEETPRLTWDLEDTEMIIEGLIEIGDELFGKK